MASSGLATRRLKLDLAKTLPEYSVPKHPPPMIAAFFQSKTQTGAWPGGCIGVVRRLGLVVPLLALAVWLLPNCGGGGKESE